MKIITAIFLLLISFNINAQDAREILKKSEDILRGTSSIVEMKMTVERPKWTREMEMKAFSKGEEFSLIYVLTPKRERGTSFLKREKEIWNWVPTVERVIKMPPSMMMQNWMGSDFTNDDLVRSSSVLDDYTHSVIGSEVLQERDCHIIEMIPNEDAAVVWGKVKTWISKKDFLQLKVEFFDEDDYLVNVMDMSNIKTLGGRTIPTKMTIIPQEEPENKTIIEYLNIDFDVSLDEDFFNKQKMKRIQ